MVSRWHYILTGLIGCLLSIIIYASDAESVTVYAQVTALKDACTKLQIFFEKHNALQPTCRVIHPASGKLQLNWKLISKQFIKTTLDEAISLHEIEWYELKSETFTTHSLGVINTFSGTSNKFDSLSSNSSVVTPWFVSDSMKKLSTALQVHDAYHVIVVAIIDSGVNFEGSLATATVWTNPGEINSDGLDNDGNGYIDDVHGWDFVETGVFSFFDDAITPDNNTSDRLGHGTAVAAILLKTVGEEFRPYVTIMPLRVASNSGGSGAVEPAALAEAIYYAADNGANIINISLAANQNYRLVEDAVLYAMSKGVRIVASAGNSGGSVMFPASVSGVLSVGASDVNGGIWSGSAFGSEVDIFAPGVNMLTDIGVNTFNLSGSGTSFAAPVVSGALAMMMSFSHGYECNYINNYFFKITPVSKSVDDFLSLHSDRIERQILAGTDVKNKWKINPQICGANSFTVNALLR